MNQPQANWTTNFLHPLATHAGVHLTRGIIATELQKTTTDPITTIKAALTTIQKIKTGTYQTFQMIHQEITTTQASQTWPTPTPHTSGTPHTTPCKAHPWAPKANCSGCWAEIKAGHRSEVDYGNPDVSVGS